MLAGVECPSRFNYAVWRRLVPLTAEYPRRIESGGEDSRFGIGTSLRSGDEEEEEDDMTPLTPLYRVNRVNKHGFTEGFCMFKG